MFIEGKRIRSLDRHLGRIDKGTAVVFTVSLREVEEDVLDQIGFSRDPEEGEVVLPASSFGARSRYNAEGKDEVHRDQPMETAYRQVEWTWEEWHGPYDRVEQSKIVDVPYKRYPRTFLPPPSVELEVRKDSDEELVIATPAVEYELDNKDHVLHVINLMLEIFGHCRVVTSELAPISFKRLRRVNWEILPRGRRPWEDLRHDVEKVVEEAPEGNQPVIFYRLETINEYEPEFVALGRAGFRGYLIFGFPDQQLYVLESAFTGNATYVFGEDWKQLSKLTKAEILSESLQEDRVIHREGWEKRIRNILGK